PGHAFHVEGDEDLHPERAWRVLWRPPAPPSGAWLARAHACSAACCTVCPTCWVTPDSSSAACCGWEVARFQANASMTPTATGPTVATSPVRPRSPGRRSLVPPRTGSLLRTDRERTRISRAEGAARGRAAPAAADTRRSVAARRRSAACRWPRRTAGPGRTPD